MELIQQCYHYLFWGVLIALALCVVVALIYIIRSHLTVDRIIGINIIVTISFFILLSLSFEITDH